MDDDAFTRGMQLLSAVFDPDAISPQKVEARFLAYRYVLQDVDGGDFLEACHWAMRRYTFFPKPAELLAYRSEAARAAETREDGERRRIRGEYYAALNAEVDARGTPAHAEALERLRLAAAAYRGVPPETLVPAPDGPELTRAEPPASPPSGEAQPGPVPVVAAPKVGVVDLAERRAKRKGAG